MRNIDETRYSADPWYAELGKDERLLFDWLICRADKAGFVSIVPRSCFIESLLTEEEQRGALQGLARGYRGVTKVLVRVSSGSGEELVWLRNFVKCQCRTTILKPSQNFHISIIRRFTELLPLFPEIKDTYSLSEGEWSEGLVYRSIKSRKGLSKVSSTPRQPLGDLSGGSLEGKGREGTLRGESEGSGSNDPLKTANTTEVKTARRLWDKMHIEAKSLTTNPGNFKLEGFVHAIRSCPDVDWDKVVDRAILEDLNGGVGKPLGYIMSLAQNAKYIKGPAKTPEAVEMRKAKAAIDARYNAGEIDEDECRRLQAELKGAK